MKKMRAYSQITQEAVSLLGKQIRLGRKRLQWTEQDLASRMGTSRTTVQKIEKGDLGCAVGLAFEAAALVGVKFFESDYDTLSSQIERIDDKIALLPKSIHKSKEAVNDDF